MTVNEILSLCKAVRGRLSSLESLRDKVSVKETYFGVKEKVITPQYNCILVDQKITQLQSFLFKADSKIKQINAITDVPNLDVDIDDLLAPLR